jgi:site-specific DNA-methyltransferase (adenine-specific)
VGDPTFRTEGITVVNIADLNPHPKNPNTHSAKQVERLAKLLEYQGVRRPVTVSKLSGFMTVGHGMVLAAKSLGWKKIPVSYQDYESEDQEYAHMVSDNAIGSWSDLDLSKINFEVQSFDPSFNIDMLGIDDFAIEPADKYEAQCDPDELPERVEPRSKLGDIYQVGRHRVMCGNSVIMTDILALMRGEMADMVWTDPPYNVKYEGRTKEKLKIANDSMEDEEFYRFLYDVYIGLLAVTKPGGAIYVAHADTEGANFRTAMKKAGWLLKQCLIWNKSSLVMGRQDYQWKHEPILYGWAPGAAHSWYSDRKQTTVLEFDKPSRNGEHPTMKPVALVEYCLGNSAKSGHIVLDLFGGSGTTLIAAEKLGMSSRIMELDPKYCDFVIARWEKFTGAKAELITEDP